MKVAKWQEPGFDICPDLRSVPSLLSDSQFLPLYSGDQNICPEKRQELSLVTGTY